MKNYWLGKHRYENEVKEANIYGFTKPFDFGRVDFGTDQSITGVVYAAGRYDTCGELKDVKLFDKALTEEEIRWMNVTDEELDSWYGVVFKAGDVVQFIRGTKPMTVKKVKSNGKGVHCQWFCENKLYEATFSSNDLMKYEPEKEEVSDDYM